MSNGVLRRKLKNNIKTKDGILKMGKGQRARETRSLGKNENTQVKKPVKKENKWVTPLVTTIVIVFLVGILVLSTLSDNGVILRSKTVLKTDNFKVSGTVMKYAAMSTYNNMVNQWGQEIAQYLQFDNMKDSARTALEEYLVYAEAAKAAGVELDDEALKEREYDGKWTTPRQYYEDGSIAEW